MIEAKTLVLLIAIATVYSSGSDFRNGKPSDNLPYKASNNNEQVVDHLNQQAIGALMKSEANRYQQQFHIESPNNINRCAEGSKTMIELSRCFRPIWEKVRRLKYLKILKKRKRRSDDHDSPTDNGKTMLRTIADWINQFVQTINEPKMIQHGKFVRYKEQHGQGSATSFNNNDRTNITNSTTSYLQQKDLKNIAKAIEQESQNMLLEMTSSAVESDNLYFMSPRFLPLTDPEPGMKILSPDILGLNDNAESLFSIPQLLSGMTSGDKNSWIKFIMEISGVNRQMKELGLSDKLPNFNQKTIPKNLFTSKPALQETQRLFDKLETTISKAQVDSLSQRGYAFLDNNQLNLIYNNGSKFGPAPFDISLFNSLDSVEKEMVLIESFMQISDPHGSRMKRQSFLFPRVFSPLILSPFGLFGYTILSPVLFSPKILTPTILGPLILSPVLFSPVVLTPALLSPGVLSPALFSPAILSPGILSPAILSPSVLNVVVLSPAVFGGLLLSPVLIGFVILSPLLGFPIVLSPIVMSPFMLSPYLLAPVVLSPAILSPLILDPNALSPVILSPSVLNSVMLSPGVLSPVIKSPAAGLPTAPVLRLLSPTALSPNIESPKRFFWSVASPTILSRRKRKIEFREKYNLKHVAI